MKKIIVFMLISVFLCLSMTSCGEQYDNSRYDPLNLTFKSGYYQMIKEDGLRELAQEHDSNYIISSLTGQFAIAGNTPLKIFFRHPNKQGLLAYNKISGMITFACPETACMHHDCLFNGEYDVIGALDQLFFIVDDKVIMTDMNGLNQVKTDIPANATFFFATEEGLFWRYPNFEEYEYNRVFCYNYEKEKSEVYATVDKGFYCIGAAPDDLYFQDLHTGEICRLNHDKTLKNPLPNNHATPGWRYDDTLYSIGFTADDGAQFLEIEELKYETFTVLLDANTPVALPELGSYYISGDYLYFTSKGSISVPDNADKELSTYLTEYCEGIGELYRINLKTYKKEKLLELSTDGIPDSLQIQYADGDVIYLYGVDYLNFKNNYNDTDGTGYLVIYDASTGEYIEIY